MPIKTRRPSIESLEGRRLLAAVSIPVDLTGLVGAEVATPVNIDSADGVRGALVTIAYDPTVLSLSPENVTAGTAWNDPADTQVVTNIDAEAGTVTISLANAVASPDSGGSLVVLAFSILESAAPGTESPIDLVGVSLNESAIPVDPAPVSGPDPTDGLITVLDDDPVLADRIAGVVYADVNNDNQPGEFEGIPGVRITLTNQTTGETVASVDTDATGRYEFTDLAPATYRITQTQPEAYFDGGPNELTVQFAAGQNADQQHFREHSLRPEFLYNRLLSTPLMPIGSQEWVDSLLQINQDASGFVPPESAAAADSGASPAAATSAAAAAASTLIDASAPANPPAVTPVDLDGFDLSSLINAAEGEAATTIPNTSIPADPVAIVDPTTAAKPAGALSGSPPNSSAREAEELNAAADQAFVDYGLW